MASGKELSTSGARRDRLPSIELGHGRIDYTVVRGASRRYTYFRFKPDLTLEVVLPRGRSVDVEEEIEEKSEWILEQYDRLTGGERVLSGDSVMFDGRRLRVDFQMTSGEEGLFPDPASGRVVVKAGERPRIRELVRRWFLKESSNYMVRALPGLAGRAGVKYHRADVREMRNWGYCTREGRLAFSWQLIALPERLREYILYHELVHLTVPDHSPAFKRKLGSLLPDFRERQKELGRVVPLESIREH
jgi:predicted metal-dependent hydrolase